MSATDEKDRFIEAWRGVAISTVFYWHYTDRLPLDALGATQPVSLPFYSGKIGVLVFFVISGFLIAKSLAASRSLADFYAKRISRLWPLFIAASILIFVVTRLVPPPYVAAGPQAFDARSTLTDLIGQSFFLRDLGFRLVDGAFWSIIVELKFYFWIGLLAALRHRDFHRWFGAIAVVMGAVQMAGSSLPDTHLVKVGMVLNGAFAAQYLPFFAIGVLHARGDRSALFTLNLFLATIQTGLQIADNPHFSFAASLPFLFAYAGLFAADALLLKGRLFNLTGKYSYAIYLFHQVIGLTILQHVVPRLGMNLGVAATIAAVYALSILMSWLFEWRFRRACYAGLHALFERLGLGRLRIARDRELHAPAPEGKTPPEARVTG